MGSPAMGLSDVPAEINRASRLIIGAAIEVQRELGAGLYEQVYDTCLHEEMVARGLRVASQVSVPVRYKGRLIDGGFRADFVVEDSIVVELKAVEAIHRSHEAQLLTYTLGGGFALGLLFNFHAPRLMPMGFRRVVGRVESGQHAG